MAEASNKPTRRDLIGVYWLAAYLCTTENLGLAYYKGPTNANIRNVLDITSWSDASWASRTNYDSCIGNIITVGKIDETDRKSVV